MQSKISPQDLKSVMAQYTGGSEQRYRHSLMRNFIYSEGLRAVAEAAGAYWLIDILATEVGPLVLNCFKRGGYSFGSVRLLVRDGRAQLGLSLEDGEPLAWSREVDFTDFPEGEWDIFIGVDELGDGYVATGFIPPEY